jgi:hypothetical protein
MLEMCGGHTASEYFLLLLSSRTPAAMSRRGKFATGPTPYKVHFTNTEAGKTIAGIVFKTIFSIH